jgi:hypothetical protein
METPKKQHSEEQMISEWLQTSDRGICPTQGEPDFLVDQLFDSIGSNPLGRLLKIIAGMPEIRAEKLEIARRHIEQPDEILEAEMDAAMDKVLEELFSES